jgi:pimeloyl-ACP methyl ester carboxylesterase
MPRLGLTMVEGTVVEWRAKPGDRVEKGQLLLVIESEKVEVEVESFDSGTLAATYVAAGETVPIGSLLAAITAPGEAFDREEFAAAFVPEVEGAPAGAAPAAAPSPSAPTSSRAPASGIKAAPAARALAKKLSVELETVTATGPGGRITVEDVERAAQSGPGLSVDIAGSGPPLLFISGYGVDKTSWRRQSDTLQRSFTVIAHDHRGIGASRPMPDESLTITTMADDAASVLSGQAATIVGASMGAAVAIELALTHPEAVRRLVLITPTVERNPRLEAALRSWNEFDAAPSEPRIRSMLAWFLGTGFLAEAPKREAAAQALRAMAARTPMPALRHHSRALVAWLGTRVGDLGRIGVPTLVISGCEDLLVPAGHAEAIARALRAARLEALESAGHAVTIERAERVNELIGEFA